MSRRRPAVVALGALVLLGAPAAAQVARQGEDPLSAAAFVDPRLAPPTGDSPAAGPPRGLVAGAADAWARFRAEAGGTWQGYTDPRTGFLEVAEGSGVPWVPGRGNRLGGDGAIDLGSLERLARGFLARVVPMLGVVPGELALNRGRSGSAGDALWYVDFDVVRGGMVVEGARVVFRVSHGNLVQLGSENLPPPGAAVPPRRVTSEAALAAVAARAGGPADADEWLDRGSLHLLPVVDGGGRALALVWELRFRRRGVLGTWRARVDATSGELLELRDVNRYGHVGGGAYPLAGVEAVLPLPFADLTSGGFADAGGEFAGAPGATASTLDGKHVRIVDDCGPIQQAVDWTGDIRFGASGGTDCATPGHGGTGNTHAARTEYYHLNRALEAGRAWFGGNAWLAGQLTAQVNLRQTCNAYWDGFHGQLLPLRRGLRQHRRAAGRRAPRVRPRARPARRQRPLARPRHGRGVRRLPGGAGDPRLLHRARLLRRGLRRLRRRLHRLQRRARPRLGAARLGSPAHRRQLHPAPLPGRREVRRPVRPPGALRVAGRDRGAVGLRGARPPGCRQRRRLGRRRAALVPLAPDGDAGLHLRQDRQPLDLARLRHRLALAHDAGGGLRRRRLGQRHAPLLPPLRRLRPPRPRLPERPRRERLLGELHAAAGGRRGGARRRRRGAGELDLLRAGRGLRPLSRRGGLRCRHGAGRQRPRRHLVRGRRGRERPRRLLPSGRAPGRGRGVRRPPGRMRDGGRRRGPVHAAAAAAPSPGGGNRHGARGPRLGGAAGRRRLQPLPRDGGRRAVPAREESRRHDARRHRPGGRHDLSLHRARLRRRLRVPRLPGGRGDDKPLRHADPLRQRLRGGERPERLDHARPLRRRGGERLARRPDLRRARRRRHLPLRRRHLRRRLRPQSGGARAASRAGARRARRLGVHDSLLLAPAGVRERLRRRRAGGGPRRRPDLLVRARVGARGGGLRRRAGGRLRPRLGGGAARLQRRAGRLRADDRQPRRRLRRCDRRKRRLRRTHHPGRLPRRQRLLHRRGRLVPRRRRGDHLLTGRAAGPRFLHSLPPCRLVDTRAPGGALGGPALEPGASRIFALAGACGVPATAKALSLNVTVTHPGAGGHLTLYPAGQALPGTSTLNFDPGQTRANNAVLPLAADGSGGLAAHLASTAPAHLLLDVTGWFE